MIVSFFRYSHFSFRFLSYTFIHIHKLTDYSQSVFVRSSCGLTIVTPINGDHSLQNEILGYEVIMKFVIFFNFRLYFLQSHLSQSENWRLRLQNSSFVDWFHQTIICVLSFLFTFFQSRPNTIRRTSFFHGTVTTSSSLFFLIFTFPILMVLIMIPFFCGHRLLFIGWSNNTKVFFSLFLTSLVDVFPQINVNRFGVWFLGLPYRSIQKFSS